MPSAFVILPHLPLTSSGNLDRETLARDHPPGPASSSAAHQPPATLLEIEIAALLAASSGSRASRRRRRLLRGGGYSLLATRLLTLIRKRLGCEVPLAAFWNSPTIASLAAHVKGPRLEELLEEIESLTEEKEALRLLEFGKAPRRVTGPAESVRQTRPQ